MGRLAEACRAVEAARVALADAQARANEVAREMGAEEPYPPEPPADADAEAFVAEVAASREEWAAANVARSVVAPKLAPIGPCPACAGQGRVGTKIPGRRRRRCEECAGNGVVRELRGAGE